jgi:hypothetical protein
MYRIFKVLFFSFIVISAHAQEAGKDQPHNESENKIPAYARFEHYLGEKFGGGIIFYLWKDSKGEEHGLIASMTDISEGMVWNTYEKVTGATSMDDGFANTKMIVTALDNCTICAAGLCYLYEGSGHKDWYLPSSWELFELYKQMHLINKIIIVDNDTTTSVLSSEYYWSSSEGSTGSAWRQNFADGNQKYYYHKYSKSRVRAIRRF